jgi:hypothetical protein
MKHTLREILQTRDLPGLARYVADQLGVMLPESRLRFLLDQAAEVGGPAHDPWTDSTWRMWLKGKLAQTPEVAQDRHTIEEPLPVTLDVEEVLTDATLLRVLGEFHLCQPARSDDLADAVVEEAWDECLPAGESLGKDVREQFETLGGRAWLGGAPLASWLYARLALLGLDHVEEENDLGGFQARWVVTAAGRPAGVVFVEADSGGVEMLVEARTSEFAKRIKEQFLGLLLQDIKEVERCELTVHGAEVNWTNSYGWTGTHFLGASNVSE